MKKPFNQVVQARRVGILPARSLCSSILIAVVSVFINPPA